MPRCHRIKTLGARVLQENGELNLTIAHDIRVRSDAGFISLKEICHDFRAVGVHQVDDSKRYPQRLGYGPSIFDILLPGTIAEYSLFIDPILHISALYRDALLSTQECCGTAVHTPGHSYHPPA